MSGTRQYVTCARGTTSGCHHPCSLELKLRIAPGGRLPNQGSAMAAGCLCAVATSNVGARHSPPSSNPAGAESGHHTQTAGIPWSRRRYIGPHTQPPSLLRGTPASCRCLESPRLVQMHCSSLARSVQVRAIAFASIETRHLSKLIRWVILLTMLNLYFQAKGISKSLILVCNTGATEGMHTLFRH